MSVFSCLLELEERLLKFEDRNSLETAARLWEKAGSPRARRNLIDFLENFLRTRQREGQYYAPILLRRKRELQRGDFHPRLISKAQAPPLPPTKATLSVEREIDPATRAKIENWKQELRKKGFL
jgi:hypothetical protein